MYFNKNKPQLAIFIIIWKVKKVKIVTHLLTCKNERVSFIKLSIYRKVRARVVVSWKTAQLVNTTEKQNEKKLNWQQQKVPLYPGILPVSHFTQSPCSAWSWEKHFLLLSSLGVQQKTTLDNPRNGRVVTFVKFQYHTLPDSRGTWQCIEIQVLWDLGKEQNTQLRQYYVIDYVNNYVIGYVDN